MQGITVSLLSQQLQTLVQERANFEKQMEQKKKVHDEQEKLTQVITEGGEGTGKPHKPQNALMAYVEAMDKLMQGNLNVMGAQATHMVDLEPQMVALDKQVKELADEQAELPHLPYDEAVARGQDFTTRMTIVNQQIGSYGTNANQESKNIIFEGQMNNALGGSADYALDLVAKARHLVK